MIYRSTYQAARSVAPTVQSYFAELHAMSGAEPDIDLAPIPSVEIIEAIIDAAFWASLRREEGHPPKISLAFIPPDQASKPLLFGKRLPLGPSVLTKLGPGVERSGIHLGVWYDGDELYIWGTTLIIPNFCFVLDVSEPGLLVIKHRRICGFGKYTNVVVLKGDQVRIIDDQSASMPDCPAMLTSLLGLRTPSINDPVNALIQLAVSMRAHKHGGTLLIVPAGSTIWRESIVHPIQYPIEPAFGGLSDLRYAHEVDKSETLFQTALSREVDHIAGLTAVDGATVIDNSHELLAFGVKIGRAEGNSPVEQLAVIEPIIGGEAMLVHPTYIGGTRHLSAAQFVHDQRNAIALVASQDGHFTIFSWSPDAGLVQAHRIDVLLI